MRALSSLELPLTQTLLNFLQSLLKCRAHRHFRFRDRHPPKFRLIKSRLRSGPTRNMSGPLNLVIRHNMTSLHLSQRPTRRSRWLLRQIPKSFSPLPLLSFSQEHPVVLVQSTIKCLLHRNPLLGLLLRRKGFLISSLIGPTRLFQRTAQALGPFRSADHRSQLH